jgi:hypothetical protein
MIRSKPKSHVVLSKYTLALLKNFKKIKENEVPNESEKISVSPTVSFFAIAYEKLRNVIEYREGHLIRRAAIERILKRRFMLNSEGVNEGENLIRELLWARYFPNEGLGIKDIEKVQNIINKFKTVEKSLLTGRSDAQKDYYYRFLLDLMTCEIEEALCPKESKTNSLFTFYMYQVLKDKLKIENTDENNKNAYFYVTLEKSFNKSDTAYLRYRIFSLYNEKISESNEIKLKSLMSKLPDLFQEIDSLIKNPIVDRIRRFVRSQMAPFKIIFDLFLEKSVDIENILKNPDLLWNEVEAMCREKYDQTRNRLNNLAIKAIIYIFLTKMLIALILEYPLSLSIYGNVNLISLFINTIFPPILMFVIVGFTVIPGFENTKRLYNRILEIINADKSFEETVSFITKQSRPKRPTLIFGFTVFYAFTFLITFYFLYVVLTYLGFNLLSQAIFVFFITLVSYFGYRIRQIAKQYTLKEKQSFFKPFFDIFFMPILSVGRFLSRGLAKLNFFIVFLIFLLKLLLN